ncbi:MAG: hypothetical protein GEU73_09465 [Chloroflexi bacterium]|nr:hypothetical protein [Chloroflexota bacterium]
MAHPQDVRTLLSTLEARGKVYRYRDRINKDTELIPFYRVQLRGLPDADRKVILFDNVIDANGRTYDMSVLAGIYGVSEEVFAATLGCQDYVGTLEKWHYGLTHPLPPIMVEHGPVQDVIHTGAEIERVGLDMLPVPVEEPGFSGMIRAGLPMITKDPETGIRNVGTYNAFFRARDRFVASGMHGKHAGYYHWRPAQMRGEPMPVAIVIGCTPETMLAGSARIPYGEDELAIAGGMAGSAIELVRCVSVPLEVPAHAEIVIEGLVSTEVAEPNSAFGEFTGYMKLDSTDLPITKVTAISHRKDAMHTPILVGFPPSDCNLVFGYCYASQLYHHLKYERGFPIEETYFPQLSGGKHLGLIRVCEGTPQSTVWGILEEAALCSDAKYIVAVEPDIVLQDADLVNWAMSFRSQPDEDVRVIPKRRRLDASTDRQANPQRFISSLDPSVAPIRWSPEAASFPGRPDLYITLINATRKWSFPPVALPKKAYMERALQLWEAQEVLPTPHMQQPWYGYPMGFWNEDLQEDADLIAQGNYRAVGEKTAQRQRRYRENTES